LLFALVIISIVIGIFFFGFAGILNLLGVSIDSYFSLLLFVIAYFILGFFLDIFSGGLVALIARYLSGKELFLARLIIQCSFDYFALFIVDELMTSISIPPLVKLIIVLLMFLFDIIFNDKDK